MFLRGAIIALFGLSTSVSSAQAIEIFGLKIFEPDTPETVEMIDPLPYTVQLRVVGGSEAEEDAISGASTLIRNASLPASGRAGLRSMATGDYARIINALYASAHYGPKVSIQIDGAEAASLPLDVDFSAKPVVVVNVDVGPQYRFGNVTISGGAPGLDPTELGFATGGIAGSEIVRTTARQTVRAWQEQSYARAEVTETEIVADHAARRLDVTMSVAPGPRVKYGDMTITGTEAVDRAFVAYMAQLPKGKVFHPDDIDQAQRRLISLDTFRTVDITPAEELAPDGSLPIEIALTKRKPRRFGFGATLSSLDGVGIEGFWLHRNILGRAERLRFDGAVSGIGRSPDPKDYDYSASVSFIKPGVFTPETEFKLGFGAKQEKLDNYTELTLETTVGLETHLTDKLSAGTLFTLERSRVDDSFGRRHFSILTMENQLAYEGRDVPLNATSGYYLEGRLMPFVVNDSDTIAFQATLEGRAYQRLDEDGKYVLAGRARIGTVEGISRTEAPPQTLFFSGGGGSVRGYEYLSNGVTVGGQTSGGLSLAELSGELRVNFDKSLGGVAFIDAGNVGAGGFPDFDGDWRMGAGVGIRFNTGLGPLRIDLARALDRRSGDPNFALYIGLGQAF